MEHKYKIGYLGVGRGLGSHTLTNEHLERIVNTSDQWIQQRTGIKTRQILGHHESSVTLCVKAAQQALAMAGLTPDQIAYTRVGTNTYLRFPSLSALVQQELGIRDASAADLTAGCASFIFTVEDLYNQLMIDYLLRGEKKYALVIGVDIMSQVTDWTDRSTCVLFGDAAGAVIMGPVESGGILATHTRTQAEYAQLLRLDEFLKNPLDDPEQMTFQIHTKTNYPTLFMEGRKVFSVAVRTMMKDIRTVIAKYNATNDESVRLEDIEYVIPHQANLRIVAAVQEGLKLRQDQVYRAGVINYGNTSAATIPLGYVDEWNKRPGALEVDVSFGAGFASGAILRRVAEQ